MRLRHIDHLHWLVSYKSSASVAKADRRSKGCACYSFSGQRSVVCIYLVADPVPSCLDRCHCRRPASHKWAQNQFVGERVQVYKAPWQLDWEGCGMVRGSLPTTRPPLQSPDPQRPPNS